MQGLIREFVGSDGGALAQAALQHLFRVYPELEPACISYVDADEKTIAPHLARILKKYGIIKPTRPDRISGEIMKAGLELHLEKIAHKSKENQEVQVGQHEVLEIGDWAEDLAVIGRNRNLIESRLREIILNFFRYESLNSQGKDPVERVLPALPQNGAKMLRTYDLNKIFRKIYWHDLLQIVEREWPTFSRIFGDKKMFRENMLIVNDRPDAHANKIDSADVALYRRSLSWIEEKISKV